MLGSTALAAEGSRRLSLNHNDGSFVLTAPTWDLMVAKDIMVRSGANPAHITSPDGYAAISLVDNTFQQTTSPSAVPLPPAAVMAISTMVLGALFAPLRRRILGRPK